MKRIALIIALCASLSACGPTTVQSASAQSVTAADAAYTAYSIALEQKLNISGVCAAPASTACTAAKADFHAKDSQAYAELLAVRAGTATIDQLYAITNAVIGGQ